MAEKSKRLTAEQKSTLHAVYSQCKAEGIAGGLLTAEIRKRVISYPKFLRHPSNNTVRNWINKWNSTGFMLYENRSYAKKPRKLTPIVKK